MTKFMISFPDFLNPNYYRVGTEISIVIIQACIVAFIVGLYIALLGYRSAIQKKNGTHLWAAHFALLYAFWNIFFLAAYTQRDLDLGTTSFSVDFAQRAYVIVGLLLPSFAHSVVLRIYKARYLLSNRLHFFTALFIVISFFISADKLEIWQIFSGIYAFSALSIINLKVWRRYRKAPNLKFKTRSLFLGLGMSVTLFFSVLGQLRAEGFLPYSIPFLGNILTVIFLYFVYQLIETPRVREIRELMLRGVRVIFLTLVLAAIFLILIAWVGENDPELFIFNTFLASFIIISILDPLRKQLDRYILRKLILDRYEFERIIRHTLQKIRRSKSIEALTENLIEGMLQSDRIYRVHLYLLDPTSRVFRNTSNQKSSLPAQLQSDHRLISYFYENRKALLQDYVVTKDSQTILREMKSHLIFPIYQARELVGIWLIRSSLSETNPYTSFSKPEIDQMRRVVHEFAASLEQLRYFQTQDQQQRLAALGEMSAALAHEIRNPLGAIQGATQLLETSPTLENAEDVECVRILKSEIDRLQQTVEQYLQYARKPQSSDPIFIADLISKSAQSSKQKALKTNTQIHFDPAPVEGVQIYTDPLKLSQVLTNLVVNACEAFSQNVWIEVSQLENTDIKIVVRDDGPGVPTDVLPNIFVPLFTTKKAGSGLGLPICKKIVDSLNGDLSVKSKPGEGTSFIIQLASSKRSISEAE